MSMCTRVYYQPKLKKSGLPGAKVSGRCEVPDAGDGN